MISIENISIEFGGVLLFNEVSLVISKGERIALAGKNGAGKSTLLKILAGVVSPSSGSVSIPKDVSIGYLPQHIDTRLDKTVMDEAMTAFAQLHEINREINLLGETLAKRTDYESEEYLKLVDKLTWLTEKQVMLGANTAVGETEKALLGLGFKRSDFNRSTREFSGGWRMRIELAKVLLRQPDVILLDEPTNHLDIESIAWLESFLTGKNTTVVLISHDKAFLDKTTHRTVELSLGKAYDYNVPYSQYIELRKARYEQQLRAYENQQKQIQQTEEFIERFRYKATKAVQVQSRIKQLNKLERIEVDPNDTSALRISFPDAPHSGSYPVIAERLSKSFDQHQVLNNINFTLHRGEKVAFVGKNGEGKSTFIKCIMGEIPFEGSLRIGHLVQIGYFAQNQAQLLNPEHTVLETIDRVATGDIRTKIRDLLGAFMFGDDDIDKPVKVLSGGERTRLAMIQLLLKPTNLLILDEPTNHLDIRSKDMLKAALKDFNGTVIIVSHDRDFLDGLVDRIYEFSNTQIREHFGSIYNFVATKHAEESAASSLPRNTINDTVSKAPNKEHELRKEVAKQTRKLIKEINSIEQQIAQLETEKKSIEQQIALPTEAQSNDIFDKYAHLEEKITKLLERWEELNISLENSK